MISVPGGCERERVDNPHSLTFAATWPDLNTALFSMNPMKPRFFLLIFALITPMFAADPPAPTVLVGVAKVDITPDLPIRLSGYGSRSGETARAETRLFARALAIGADRQKPAVLITVELIGVGEETSDAVAAACMKNTGLTGRTSRFARRMCSGRRLALGTEDRVISTVLERVPAAFQKKGLP